MRNFDERDSVVCQNVQGVLSEYIDNLLPARQMLEVEKHLTQCRDCAEARSQLQATIKLLQTAERFDTSNDFMAKLHARLDSVEPSIIAPSPKRTLSVWLEGLREAFQGRRAPALGLGFSLAALAFIALTQQPAAFHAAPVPKPAPVVPVASISEPLRQNVALTASNPFDDPLAANLEARSAIKESDVPSDVEAMQ